MAQNLAAQDQSRSNEVEQSPKTSVNQNYQMRSVPSDTLHLPTSKVQLRAVRRHINNTNLVNGVESSAQ